MQEDSTKTTGCAHFLKGVVDSHNGTEATDRAGCCCVDHLSLPLSLSLFSHSVSLSVRTHSHSHSIIVCLPHFVFFLPQISSKANTGRSNGTNFSNLKPTLK